MATLDFTFPSGKMESSDLALHGEVCYESAVAKAPDNNRRQERKVKMNMKKTVAVMAAVMAVGLAGCASQASKNALAMMSQQEVVYGQVYWKKALDDSPVQRSCESKKAHPSFAFICENISEWDGLAVGLMYTNKVIKYHLFVPKSMNVPVGSIVKFRPGEKTRSIEKVVVREETANCKWEGTSLMSLMGTEGSMAGAAAGLLIVPAVVMAVSDEALLGGVVCEGWNYKTIWEQAKAQAAKN